jgi:hypothetical protein
VVHRCQQVDLRVTVVAAAAQGLAVDRDRPPPRRLGRVRRPLPDRDQRSGAGQHGGDRDGQHRGQRMPAAASLSGVGDLGEVLEQAAASVRSQRNRSIQPLGGRGNAR